VGRDGKAKEKKDRLEITQKVLDVLKEQDKVPRTLTLAPTPPSTPAPNPYPYPDPNPTPYP
jgi:hypothetical protein